MIKMIYCKIQKKFIIGEKTDCVINTDCKDCKDSIQITKNRDIFLCESEWFVSPEALNDFLKKL